MDSDRAGFSGARVSLLCLWLVLAAPALAGGPVRESGTASVAPPAFSGERALELVRLQCALGPRTPGSTGNISLRNLILQSAAKAGLRAVTLCFDAPLGQAGASLEACNVVVSAGPPGGERLWLGAHFDTRPWADQDPVVARREQPVPGANDGASGTAVLLHLIELLGRTPPAEGVDLLFFDAEDSGHPRDAAGFCLGSRQMAGSRQDFGHPLAGVQTRGLVVLDMIGQIDARIPMEGYSLERAPAWTEAVFARAAALGLTIFESVPGRHVFDDHVPFLLAGIPAVDLIDFDYPQWHTVADTPDQCSAATLGQVGRLAIDLIYRP